MIEECIRLENVSFKYSPSEKNVLEGISLEIKRGSFTGIAGPSGSGKTTLLKIISSSLKPSSGMMENNIGLAAVLHQFSEMQLFGENVLEDIMFGPLNMGVSAACAKKEALCMLDKMGLDRNLCSRNPFTLSGGQMRLVSASGVLVLNRDVIVLDEPVCGLDKTSSEKLMNVVSELNGKGCTVIMATHNVNDIIRYCSSSVVLENGRVVYDGPPSSMTGCISYESVFADELRVLTGNLPYGICTSEAMIEYLKKFRSGK